MTGAPRRFLTLALGLRDLGVTPVIATEPDAQLMIAAREAGIETISIELVGVLSLKKGALLGGGFFFRIQVAAALLRQQYRFWWAARKARVDAILVRGSKGVAFTGLGFAFLQQPFLWDVDYELPSKGAARLLHRMGLLLAKRVMLQHCAARTIFGEGLANRYASKFRVLLPGIDFFNLTDQKEEKGQGLVAKHDKFSILQVGTLCDRKNQAFTIDVIRFLPSELRDQVEVRFVGGCHTAAYESALRDTVTQHQLAGIVSFLGWSDDISSLMLQSDLLVMPSKDEGVPNTVQEAMFLGLPVIGSNRGGIPEVLVNQQTGWVLPLDDPKEWSETVSQIAKCPLNVAGIRDRARQHAIENFGTKTWCTNYLQEIHDACQRSTNSLIRK